MPEETRLEQTDFSKAIYDTLWEGFNHYGHTFDYTAVEALTNMLEPHFVNGNPPLRFEDVKAAIEADGPMKQMSNIKPDILRKIISSAAIKHGNSATMSPEDGQFTLPGDVTGVQVADGTIRLHELGAASSSMEASKKSAIIDLTTEIEGRVLLETGELGPDQVVKILTTVKRTIEAVLANATVKLHRARKTENSKAEAN